MEGGYSFFEIIYSKLPRGEADDPLSWKLTQTKFFDVCFYFIYIYIYIYFFFSGPLNASFPWKSIWCIKAPKRVSFLLWTTVWDRILTIDNLVKRGLSLINWCCLCRCNGDIVDHLLLHCKFAHTLWTVE